ncbi:DUF502 domain-containing protein [Clostridium cochlearium]|uniref:Uncharacterized membrane protein n=1 Tax=Clostridium cochlearium TaxID=1494 RepID=A0ABY0QKZ7_CLOCO|nr:DUF502 domain-containing protein [Clostridium cochlearium]MBU5269229.1 DUF502 domain-containing protein [Clostridium cochlearium]MCG4572226.1 DUF502 domain-containing protein [Clostridium cochlearium]MCR1971902.1 DUF502 domain-containing protein [Clostridium cochlearium]NMA58128.1 DUF502 domain-containing protein [Clostridium cochlearium]SDL11134.1 Uncharacterized membrane protein [Clostridium cochlearium]
MNSNMKKHISTFLAGISVILPAAITLYIIGFVFNFIDKLNGGVIYKLIGRRLPGLGFIMTLAIIYGAGLLAKSIIGRTYLKKLEEIFLKIPIIQHIYSAIKGLSNSILKKDKVSFKQTVLVKFPNSEMLSVGFVTSDKTIKENKISVFVPTVPNPTTGFLILVDKDDVEYLSMPFEEAFKFILSLGVSEPKMK